MLEALVIAGIVAAPLGSAALFLPGRLHRQVTDAWPVTRRFLLAVIGTALLAAAAAAILKLLHATSSNLIAGVAGLVAVSVIWLPVTRRWSPRAHLCWASTTFLFVVYLTFALDWTFASHLGPASTIGGVLLWFLEGLAGIIAGLTKAGQLSGPLLAALLLFPTLGLAAAPYNSLAARRAALPAQLRERRRTEYRRDRRTFAAGIATGGAVAVAGVAALAIVLMLGGHHVADPSLVGPARGTPATTAPSTPATHSSTPASTPSTSQTPTPSTTAPSTSVTPTPTPSTSVTTTPTTTPSTTPTTTVP